MDVAAGKLKHAKPCPRVLVSILFERCPWGAAAAVALLWPGEALPPSGVTLPPAAAPGGNCFIAAVTMVIS
jgi:hypothetical protein